MVKVNNDIKILFTKYNEFVTIDDIGGEALIYNHSFLLKERNIYLEDYYFSGIKLNNMVEYVEIKPIDLYGNTLYYIIYNDYLYIEKQPNLSNTDPICVLGFYIKNSKLINSQFYAHFIEQITN